MTWLERMRRWRPWRRGASAVPDGMVRADRVPAQARREGAAAVLAPPDPELVAERARLTERFALMQADLGGVFYEMAIRDHVRMDVLTRKAAELQRVDAQLEQVERALRGDDGPVTGACPSCGAPQGATSRFCSQCGHSFSATTNGSSPAGAR